MVRTIEEKKKPVRRASKKKCINKKRNGSVAGNIERDVKAAGKAGTRAESRKARSEPPNGLRLKGLHCLAEVAVREIEGQSAKIVKALVDGTLKGKANSAKLLIEIAREATRENEGKETGNILNLLDSLGSQRQWVGEVSESTAEVALGSREPEN